MEVHWSGLRLPWVCEWSSISHINLVPLFSASVFSSSIYLIFLDESGRVYTPYNDYKGNPFCTINYARLDSVKN